MRRNNLVEFFLDTQQADKYISTHLYGAIADMHNADVSMDDASDLLSTSAAALVKDLSTTFEKRATIEKIVVDNKIKRKLSPFETYIALLKGYCAIAILIMPKAFVNGGWAASALLEVAAALITTICAAKLVQAGLMLKMYSYSLIVEKALGTKGRVALDFMIAATQFGFTVSHIVFIVESLKTTVDGAWGINTSPGLYAAAVVCILTPIAWERNIARFAFTYLIGVSLLVWASLVVTFYCFGVLSEERAISPSIVAIRPEGYLTTLGMAVYSFEGIGVVMPIMHACECPEKFTSILTSAMITLVIAIVVFSELCYLTWGNALTKPFVLEMLPGDTTLVIVTKILVCVNLVCTYPIAI